MVPFDLRGADAPAERILAHAVSVSPAYFESMPVDAKAGCLYPNNARALFEAQARGFDNAIVCDMLGNVAETATSNVFMAKQGVVYTPMANGTFLAGITRQRVIGLLRDCRRERGRKDVELSGFRRRRRDIFHRETIRKLCR